MSLIDPRAPRAPLRVQEYFQCALDAYRNFGAPPDCFQTYVEWINRHRNVAALRYLCLVAGSTTSEQQSQILLEVLAQLRWVQYGAPVCDITAGLAGALLLTRTTPLSEIQWPFPALVLRPPRGILSIVSQFTGKPVDVVFIAAHRIAETEGRVRIRITLHSEDHGQIWIDHRPEWFDRYVQTDDSAEILADMKWVQATTFDLPDRDPRDDDTWQRALRLVLNFLSWFSAQPGGIASGMPHNRAANRPLQQPAPEDAAPIWVFGREVKLSPELRAAAVASLDARQHRDWAVMARHIVRGHFRNQPCGEGRQQIRRIWISPFWRGPEGAARWQHIYRC